MPLKYSFKKIINPTFPRYTYKDSGVTDRPVTSKYRSPPRPRTYLHVLSPPTHLPRIRSPNRSDRGRQPSIHKYDNKPPKITTPTHISGPIYEKTSLGRVVPTVINPGLGILPLFLYFIHYVFNFKFPAYIFAYNIIHHISAISIILFFRTIILAVFFC